VVHVHLAVLNTTLTLAGKSGPSAQDRYCARGLGGGAKKWETEKNRDKSSNYDSYVTCVDVHCFL